MKRVFRNLSVVILVIFALSITGCLSQKTEKKEETKVVQTKPDTDTGDGKDKEPTTGDTELPVYVPSDKERPELIKFQALSLDTNVVAKGQTVKFTAEALTGQYPITIKYSATGGEIDANGNWKAPDKAGFYQVMAYAIDTTNNLKSEPLIIDMRVAKEGNSGIVLSAAPSVVTSKVMNGPKRAIGIDDVSTAQNVSRYILDTSGTGNTATIQLKFSDTNDNHVISPSFSVGTLTPLGETKTGTLYTATYTYTAPATVPTSGRANVEFNIFNPSNGDSDTATVSFIINTKPTVSKVEFSTVPESVIGLGATKTIKVTASDADQTLFSDKLTFTYTIISGSGSLSTGNSGSNTTGEVDYTAPATSGKLTLLVLVQDTRGASAQSITTFYIQNPMSMVVADMGIKGDEPNGEAEKYAEATGDYAARYRLLTKGTTSPLRWAIGNNGDLATQLGANAYYYFKDTAVARASQQVTWSVFNEASSSTAIMGPNNGYLATGGLLANMQDETAGYNYLPNAAVANYLGRGGTKTIKARVLATDPVTKAPVTVESSDTVMVNEFPYITGVTFKDAVGNTQSWFNGSTSNVVQVPYDQSFTFSVSVFDAENDRIAPTTTDYAATVDGFFANVAYGSNADPAVNEALPGIRITNNLTAVPAVTEPSWANAGANNTGITTTYTHPTNYYTTSVTDYSVTVGKTATIDTTDKYHYMYLHVTDGYGVPINATGGSTVDYYRVGYEMAVADTTARLVDIGTVANKTSFTKNLCLEFVTINSVKCAKIKDLDTNTYLTKANGDAVVIDTSTLTVGLKPNIVDGSLQDDGVTNGTDYIQLDTVANENLDWLAIAFDPTNFVAGDKVYFKTYANTVVVKYQVVEGARITGVDIPTYVTLGETVTIRVAGFVSGTSTSASVTITEPSNASGGTLEAGNDTDGDTITNEVWTYKAPSTWPANKTVTFSIKITDSLGNVSTLPKTIELNRKPVVNGVMDSDGMAISGADYWILSGVNNLKIIADSTDPDGATDVLKYDWYVNSQYGTLTNLTQPVTYWSPIGPSGFLTGGSGPLLDGKIPFTVAARDFDKNNQPKGGYSGLKSFNIGINEAPVVGTLANQNLVESPTNGVDFSGRAKYLNSKINVGITDAPLPSIDLNDSEVDRNSLNFQWYVIDQATGRLAQDIGTFYTAATTIDNLAAQTYWWIPNKAARQLGGTYVVHARVTDDKPGAAKGITDVTATITLTADAGLPVPVAADILVEEKIDNGFDNIYGIGDKIRFKVLLNSAGNTTLYDMESATLDITPLTDALGAPGTTIVDMVYSDAGTVNDYSDDYLYYDFEVKSAAAAANDVDLAGRTAIQFLPTDTAGNVAVAGTDLAAPGVFVDNWVDVTNYGLQAVGTDIILNRNPNTGLPTVLGTVLHIGDEIDLRTTGITATDDLSVPYATAPIGPGTQAKINGTNLGLGSAIPSDAYGGKFTFNAGKIILGEYEETSYDAVAFGNAAFSKIPMSVTDDAGNVANGLITGGASGFGIDLKRPKVSSVTMYSYRTVGVVGPATNDDILTEKDGTTHTVLSLGITDLNDGTDMAAASLVDDNDDSTMEIVAIKFDEEMTNETLNELAIQVNLVTVPKVSLSKGATANDAGAAAVGTFNTGRNYYYDDIANTLYIALVGDSVNTSRHIARNSVIEILFNDNTPAILSEALANRPYAVVADANANEIDYTRDFSDGQLQGYLQW